jgi:hypothetical protein
MGPNCQPSRGGRENFQRSLPRTRQHPGRSRAKEQTNVPNRSVCSLYGLVLFTLLEERFSAGLTLLPTQKAAFLFRRWVVHAVEVEGFGFGPGAERCFVNGEWNLEESGAPPASP